MPQINANKRKVINSLFLVTENKCVPFCGLFTANLVGAGVFDLWVSAARMPQSSLHGCHAYLSWMASRRLNTPAYEHLRQRHSFVTFFSLFPFCPVCCAGSVVGVVDLQVLCHPDFTGEALRLDLGLDSANVRVADWCQVR